MPTRTARTPLPAVTAPSPAPPRRRLVLGAACSAVAFALLLAAALAAGLGPTGADSWWATVLAGFASPGTVAVQRAVSDLGGGLVGAVLIPLAAVLVLLRTRGRRAALTLAAALAGSAVAVQVVKHVVARPRPADQLVSSDFGSFPSGHVAGATTLAVGLALLVRRRWLVTVAIVWPAVMAVSRTVLQVHWLTDVLAGAALGTGVAFVAVLAAGVVPDRATSDGGPR